MPMPKPLFISYCHRQGPWVRERFFPILRAAGCRQEDIFVDWERFTAGRGVIGQMDAWQDRAELSLLVLSPDYLASDYCRHEMDRAIAYDPGFAPGKVLPVRRVPCDLTAFTRHPNPPVWVDLTDDRRPDGWALLLEKTLGADRLGTSAPHWLDVRDELVAKLRDQQQSVNLVVRGEPNWGALLEHLRQDWLPELAVVDLGNPATAPRDGLIKEVFSSLHYHQRVPRKPYDLVELSRFFEQSNRVCLAIENFDMVVHRSSQYGFEFFNALRFYVDARKLILLVHSFVPFHMLCPPHPLSRLDLFVIELR